MSLGLADPARCLLRFAPYLSGHFLVSLVRRHQRATERICCAPSASSSLNDSSGFFLGIAPLNACKRCVTLTLPESCNWNGENNNLPHSFVFATLRLNKSNQARPCAGHPRVEPLAC